MAKKIIPYLLFVGFFGLDQLVALFFFFKYPELIHSNPFFQFSGPVVKWAFAIAILILLWWLNTSYKTRSAIILMAAGFMSNFTTHIWYGGYIDYIPTGLSYINTADLITLAGCILLAFHLFFGGRSD